MNPQYRLSPNAIAITADTVFTGDESVAVLVVREICRQCRRSYKNAASVRSHWNIVHRSAHGDFIGSDPAPPESPCHKRKDHPLGNGESKNKVPKTARLTCTHCQGTYQHKNSLRSHWNKAHRQEHGPYVGHGAIVPVPGQVALPAVALDIMNLSPEHFQSCRVTSNAHISVIDSIMIFTGSDRPHASKMYRRLSLDLTPFKTHHFPGAGQRATPVATFDQLMPILERLPGYNAQTLTRFHPSLAQSVRMGDPRVVKTIVDNGDLRPKTRTTTLAVTDANTPIPATDEHQIHATLSQKHADALTTPACVVSDRDQRTMCSYVSAAPASTLIHTAWLPPLPTFDKCFLPYKPVYDADDMSSVGSPPVASVYFVRAKGSTFVKVGFSADPQRLLIDLQTTNAFLLELEFQYATTSYRRVERDLRQYLTDMGCHTRENWFRIPTNAQYLNLIARACPDLFEE
jgi:hypothetical protein